MYDSGINSGTFILFLSSSGDLLTWGLTKEINKEKLKLIKKIY